MAKNILICDDAAFMRMMIKDILTKNGYNVAGEAENGLKAVEKFKVIMCSAMGQQAMVIESIQAGAKDFIVKPFQAERVIEAVKKVVG